MRRASRVRRVYTVRLHSDRHGVRAIHLRMLLDHAPQAAMAVVAEFHSSRLTIHLGAVQPSLV
jgi:hypothetical protein